MKTNLKISLVAGLLLAAGLAYSQAPMGGGQCDMMGRMVACRATAWATMAWARWTRPRCRPGWTQRHAALKAQLKLTAAQEAAWTAFVDAHKPPAGMMDRQAAMADMAKLTTPERIDKMKELRAQHMGEMTAAMDKRAEATKTFYAVLTPEQQKVFDAQSMMGSRPWPWGCTAGKGNMQPKHVSFARQGSGSTPPGAAFANRGCRPWHLWTPGQAGNHVLVATFGLFACFTSHAKFLANRQKQPLQSPAFLSALLAWVSPLPGWPGRGMT